MATKAKAKKAIKTAKKAVKKSPVKAAKKAPAKKVVRKLLAKTAKKPVAKGVAHKKPVAKKPLAKKAATKKPAAKNLAAKQQKRPVAKATHKAQAKKPVVKVIAKPVVKPAAKVPPRATLVKSGTVKVVVRPVTQPQPLPQKVAQEKSALLVNSLLGKKPDNKRSVQDRPYRVGDYVVYPTHGVGRIMAEETQNIGEIELRMLVISFDKDKMTLRVPTHRAAAAGLRHVSSTDQMVKVFETLKGKARTSRGMWSRRAQEYEAKINSGNIFSVAEVVRDLHQNVDQSERSYSERMIYESALGRLVGELAASEAIDQQIATEKLLKLLRSRAA